ncbi:unnamed protein product [Rotaria sp. Silwood1]|nr:unnamed protein product [Rotaria sp. Silwood1]CAF4827219.1 unnamed protein product [Rotaria sp. Silwood1]CAF5004281.1 unnamed protein product [Rotaria sp. Silwood1]
MGSGCCKTKIADASLAVMQTQHEAATEIPYGYVFIYPGVLTPNQTYTTPMLSIHTYHQSSKKTAVDYVRSQFSNKKQFDRQLGSLATSKEEHLSSDETVIMIPVEDVINIYYTSDIKKSIKAVEYSRLVPVASEKGCCDGCCKKAPPPVRQTEIVEAKNAQRIITIHLQYSKYSNLDTVSNARILSESDRAQFYKNHFRPNEELNFYLVRNAEYDSANFDQKTAQAENLCRIIMQLKGINGGVTASSVHPPTKENVVVSAASTCYPSPQELQQILNQPSFGIFGDVHQERFHSIQTQQDFGTHAPVPVTTTVVAAITMRPTDTPTSKND